MCFGDHRKMRQWGVGRENRAKDERELKKDKRQEKDGGYQKGERKQILKDKKKERE